MQGQSSEKHWANGNELNLLKGSEFKTRKGIYMNEELSKKKKQSVLIKLNGLYEKWGEQEKMKL